MTAALLTFVVFLGVWRLVFAILHRRPRLRETAVPRQRYNNFLEASLLTLDQPATAVMAESAVDTFPDRIRPSDPRSRANTRLHHILALTGAKQLHDGYVLDVGKTRFYVRDRSVRRLRDATCPQWGYEETCFYSVHKGMPRVEEIATALLQLYNNPALFDKWAAQNGLAYKADGNIFTHIFG